MMRIPGYPYLLDRLFLLGWILLLAGCKKLDLTPIPFVGETEVKIDEVSGEVRAVSTLDDIELSDIDQHGHLWGETIDPVLPSPDKTELGAEPDDISFQSRLRRLDGETQYYVRPYFRTREGEVIYGSSVAFQTPFSSFLDLIVVEGGSKILGALSNELGADDERPAREITLGTFAIGRYEVTQSFWEAVMGDNPSLNRGCPKCPVEQVTWFEAREFIDKLNQQLPGRRFRLPTEAQWEFAARGGNLETNRFLYSGSNNLDEVGWFFSNSDPDGDGDRESQEVGLKKPNALGLYDMTGNVIEWCEDWWNFSYYTDRPALDPPGPEQGTLTWNLVGQDTIWFRARVCRSSFFGEIEDAGDAFARISNRNPNYAPTFWSSALGFRLAEKLE